MVNYNQKYKEQVICTITDDNGNLFDSTLTDDAFFVAVGQKTSNGLSKLTKVSGVNLYSVKPDTILNFNSGNNIKMYDDSGSISTISTSNLRDKHWTSIVSSISTPLRFGRTDNNVRFDDFDTTNSMTLPINNFRNVEKVVDYTAKVTTPNDVKCNYTTGNHQFITGFAVNILFDGNIKKGDTITVKRNNRSEHISTMNFDTDLAFVNLGMDGNTDLELIYKHNTVVTQPVTIQFTSSDNGAKWSNDTMIDDGTGKQTNTIIFQPGYKLSEKLKVTGTKKDGSTDTLFFGTELNSFDGDISGKNHWSVTIPTGYVKINIETGNIQYKEYQLISTLQNAKIIEPKPVENDWGANKYYLDPKHTTITIKANSGYSFENDGILTYQKDETNQGTIIIKATHTDTVTVILPSDINWSYQKDFNLTIGAVKPEIVENAGGFTNIYKADYNNLLKFSNEVIAKASTTSSADVQTYNITPYIDNLVMLPFNVPAGGNSSIVVGNETFKTQLPTVDNNYLNVDLGKIVVDEQYKNGFDYFNVKTRLMLPYTNLIELDPKHVINKTVSIKYIVNVVNGDTTINLYNDDDLFLSQQVNLANEIPFISKATNGQQYRVINQLKTMFRNDINQAYIIIEQPTPILNADYYETNEKGTLKNYTGNVKAKLLNNMDINSNDLISLQNLLETGVNIK